MGKGYGTYDESLLVSVIRPGSLNQAWADLIGVFEMGVMPATVTGWVIYHLSVWNEGHDS